MKLSTSRNAVNRKALEVEKAFNKPNWNFLIHMLRQKGFKDKWINWIYGCMSTICYSIIINGKQRGYIQATRGIRQGDPLSPFLFVIAMDYLSNLMEDARSKGIIKGYVSRNNLVQISHLLFVEDILLLSIDNATYMKNLRFIIKTFEKAFGLIINLLKSSVLALMLMTPLSLWPVLYGNALLPAFLLNTLGCLLEETQS